MPDITDAELAAWERLEREASPRPWDFADEDVMPPQAGARAYVRVFRLLDARQLDLGRFRFWEENEDADARLICAARNNFARLLAEVRRLRGEG